MPPVCCRPDQDRRRAATAHRHNGRAAADGLVGKRRSTGERKYYPSNLPADTALKDLALAIKARWVCEQAHQQSKEELAIDHFEGRSWIGLHPHALLATMAYSFL